MADHALDTDLESKTSQALGDSTWVVGGAAIVGGLLLVSYVLYMVYSKVKWEYKILNGIGPVDNRPSTDKLHRFVKK